MKKFNQDTTKNNKGLGLILLQINRNNNRQCNKKGKLPPTQSLPPYLKYQKLYIVDMQMKVAETSSSNFLDSDMYQVPTID